jgi:hypothetical protein
MLAASPSVFGQSPPSPLLLGTTLDTETLRRLPASGNPFTLLDAVQTEAIGDRFLAAGLNPVTPPRAGGLLSSWTQTQIRFGDVSITDPRTGGTPLFAPFLPFFSSVTVATGAMGVDDNAPALSMTLTPLAPTTVWQRTIGGFATGGPLTSGAGGPGSVVPSVDRVARAAEGYAAATGRVNDVVGLAAGASWRGLSHVEFPASDATADRVATGFAHLTFRPTNGDIRAIGVIQHATTATFTDTSVHTQGAWSGERAEGTAWRVFAGYTERRRSVAPAPRTAVVDSLESDPISDLFDSGAGASRRWTVGARLTPATSTHMPAFGVDVENLRARFGADGPQNIRELVNGVPARVWIVHRLEPTDYRTLNSVAGFVSEHVTAGRLTVDAGVRLDTLRGGADASRDSIGWATWLPRGQIQWQWTRKGDVAAIAGYRRSAFQMPLAMLAVGDSAAPWADVRLDTLLQTLVAQVGPGAGPGRPLTQIDPNLRRPITDELVLALRARPFHGFEVEFARVAKRESSLITLADTGVPVSRYTSLAVPDPSYVASTAGPFDRPFAIAYNRPANVYGTDFYQLTNPAVEAARSWAMELNVRATTDRITFIAGGALTWADGPAAAIGFLPTENDQNVLGSAFVDANRDANARGQLFQDRSHVVKMAGVYRFPNGFSVGAIARYQDGQPFARLLAVQGLNQGATLVRAYRNGGAAFTYTGTLDVRVERTLQGGRVTVGADVYNLPNLAKEVSEYVVAGPRFRDPTALQPPRAAVVSLRVVF